MNNIKKIINTSQTTVNLQKQINWYTTNLGFSCISETRIDGLWLGELIGIPGAIINKASLRIGEEFLELWEFEQVPTQKNDKIVATLIPEDSQSNDLWFQHICIVVSNLNDAFNKGASNATQISRTLVTLPESNKEAANIEAVKIKDSVGHPLELLKFPQDKGSQRWHKANSKLFMGIDHTAIGVSDTQKSIAFYNELLGMEIAGNGINYGKEQDQLDGLINTKVVITSLRANSNGMGIELLDYQLPNQNRRERLNPKPTDLSEWRTMILVEDIKITHKKLKKICSLDSIGPIVSIPPDYWGGTLAFQARDPDGHALIFLN